ncbi:hypothetical protein Tco_0583683 [Tanacetum coccineum]
MTGLILKEYIEKTQAESSLAKPNTNNDMNIELNEEFLIELQSNAYCGMIDEDVVDHIAKVLEILDLIKISNVDTYRLRMKAFPLLLAEDARRWWIDEGDEKITTWEELVKKFFCKFYPLSRDGEDEMLDEEPMDDIVSSDDEWEESDYGNPPNTYTNTESLFKPYLDDHKKLALEKRMNGAKRNPRVWKSVQYGVSKELDTAYWGFLGVGTTFDIFQNIHTLYIEYGVLTSSGYGVLSFIPLWYLVSAGTDRPYLP